MINKLRRFYNKNSRGIWLVIIIIALLFIFLQLIDNWVEEKNKEKMEAQKQNNNIQNNIKTENNVKLESKKSGVTKEERSSTSLNREIDLIQNFLKNCNERKIEEAYNLLTQDCKEEMYKSIDDFKNLYCDKNFTTGNMNFNIENWINSTYKINIYKDIMATGKESDSGNLQDYITVKKVDDEYKLNINNYIGRYDINKEEETDDIKIIVLSRNVYMDYETYNIRVENNTEKDILLDTKQDVKSMYIKDNHDARHSSYSHELSDADLFVQKGQTRSLEIKYYSSFNSNKKIKSLVFSNVVMDYNQRTGAINRDSIQKLEISI